MKMYVNGVKRLVDLVLSLLILFVTGFLFLFILSVNTFIYSKPFFRQIRVGKGMSYFTILKFRTMDKNGKVSKWSKILRLLGLDELPQLFNVIAGQMSIVGPRPILTTYTNFLSEEEKLRFAVKPGITGLAQVNGRNMLDWKSKLNFDIQYVQRVSLVLDATIICKTFSQLAKLEDGVAFSLLSERKDILEK